MQRRKHGLEQKCLSLPTPSLGAGTSAGLEPLRFALTVGENLSLGSQSCNVNKFEVF